MNLCAKNTSAVAALGLGLIVSACGGGDGFSTTGPGGVTVANLAGRWTATRMAWLSGTGDGLEFELIGAGGSATLVIQSDGRYTFTSIDPEGITDIDNGTLGFDPEDEEFMVIQSDEDSDPDSFFFIQNDNSTIGLRGEDVYDFDDDGVDERAALEIDFTRN